ncbi:MAG: hypothetical protein HY907_16010 [Deltaproteobacteria bacterium]|nr:hypothetical protein [Deltaproteobacteria bacterium]
MTRTRTPPSLLFLVLTAIGCPVKPPDLPVAPERPDVGPLGLLDPGAEVTLLVRPQALAASALGDATRRWFEPTPEEAARGGPAQWFRDLGDADEAIVSFAREDDLDLARAVRGGPDDGRALARRLAERAEAEHAPIAQGPCADVTAFTVGGTGLAAVGAGLFVLAPGDTVAAACRRATGEETASLASDPRVAPLTERLDLAAAQLVYLGRVPPSLRPQLQHWGVDPLVDRIVGVSVAIGDEETAVRAVAEVTDEAEAAELVRTATEGIDFMASRRSYAAVGLSPLIRRLVPRSEGAFFFVEASLPTAAIGVVLSQLRTVEEASE